MRKKFFNFVNKVVLFFRSHRRLTLTLAGTIGVFLVLLAYEFRTSRLQARYFSSVGKELRYQLRPGPSQRIRFPTEGPYDERLGYTRIPAIIRDLLKEGYFVEAQAEISERMASLVDSGIFAIYPEKNQAGLKVIDRNGERLYEVERPERIFKNFLDIPQIITKTILFIENREILDPSQPYRNPAVEWDRLGKALLEKFIQIFKPNHSAPGGSTIATQLEKYLHGYEGRTRNIKDKFMQMLSASYRAYLDGEKTYTTREKIVLRYINSIPLAALSGYGEVNGLADGLWAWYGLDFNKVNEQLIDFSPETARKRAREIAPVYKKVLSLFVAHRRPSFYLLSDSSNLDQLTNEYLHVMAAERIIPLELRDEALKVKLELRTTAPPPPSISFVERKAANAIRIELLRRLKFRHTYHLDQVDLTVKSTLDKKINEQVAGVLASLKDREQVKKLGLAGERTLGKGDPAKVIYSVTLYERMDNVNVLRVQTDNLDRPFDINEGTRLDLGSTAKLRVLVNYLEVIADLYDEFSNLDKKKFAEVSKQVTDPLSRWIVTVFQGAKKPTLKEVLELAMQRTYSASPAETFFTGGGIHTFVNFNKEDNGRTVTLTEALRTSINLPFIRLIRDLLRYYMAQLSGENSQTDAKRETRREQYLEKFADKEGSYFIRSFYKKYRGQSPSEIIAAFVKSTRPTAKKLAVIFRHVKPEGTLEDFAKFVSNHLPKSTFTDKALQSLFDTYPPGKYSLQDQGYLVRTHPLELWLVGYLVKKPEASLTEVIEASQKERQEVYQWLMKKGNRRAQDSRIRSIIEAEGFLEMFKSWKKVGYPFKSMVPSYASAIGNSGDRPAALAELMGIILNDGVLYPMQRMERLHFAKGTPFETVLNLNHQSPGERVMRAEVAALLRDTLRIVVENGTARRVDKAFKNADGKPLPIGGKTGTGDNRYETFGKGGQLLTSRVVNRTATFVFYVGEKFFGTVTAHVQGPDAANYDFTSALAAELLKAISPALAPLVSGEKAAVYLPTATPAATRTKAPMPTVFPTLSAPVLQLPSFATAAPVEPLSR